MIRTETQNLLDFLTLATQNWKKIELEKIKVQFLAILFIESFIVGEIVRIETLKFHNFLCRWQELSEHTFLDFSINKKSYQA